MKRLLALSILSLPLLTANIALADSCEEACPDGQVRVSFADGQDASCICTDPGTAMNDDTTENPEGDGSGPEPGPDA